MSVSHSAVRSSSHAAKKPAAADAEAAAPPTPKPMAKKAAPGQDAAAAPACFALPQAERTDKPKWRAPRRPALAATLAAAPGRPAQFEKK